MIPEEQQGKGHAQRPLEVPIGLEPEVASGRFVSARRMYQIRARILKKLSVQMRKGLGLDADTNSLSSGLS
jgi:hypothetical protein